MLFIRLFLKYQNNLEVISIYPSPRVCLKNRVNNIFPEPKIDRLLSRLMEQATKFAAAATDLLLLRSLGTWTLRKTNYTISFNWRFSVSKI